MDLAGIKNIIFDFGGVLLNLDYHKTDTAFKDLGFTNFDEMYSQFKADHLFEKLETGSVSEEQFFVILNKAADKPIDKEAISAAWSAMLLDYRKESLDCLKELSKNYQLFLLSNTNILHQRAFYDIYEKQFGRNDFNDHFAKAWYSHEIGMRKPNKEIYEFVLKDAGLIAGETLFIDDSYPNLPPAREAGIRTHLLLPEERIETLLL
jgi:putative hydrolase of the HAD superfamily